MNQRTIQVQGRGTVTQAPDRIRILLTLDSASGDFATAIEMCNSEVAAVRSAAQDAGIDPAELKTTHFHVAEQKEYISGRHQFVGFEATHQLGVVLPIDKDLIGRFLSSVIRSNSKPQIRLGFEVADAEGLKQKVIASAVENAKRRAETIAEAAGTPLGTILKIEYGHVEVRISSGSCDMEVNSAEPGADIAPDLDPDDVSAEDSVTITWDIPS